MIDEEKRSAVFDKYGGRCYYCEKQLSFYNRNRQSRGSWEVDHLVAQANGGHSTHLNNLVPACWGCNLDKSTRSSRAHRLSVAADRQARDSRRQWRTAEGAALPGLLVAWAVHAYMKENGPSEEQQQTITLEERQNHFWKMLLVPAMAGLAAIAIIVVISEMAKRA